MHLKWLFLLVVIARPAAIHAQQKPPNIILVTLDTVRADRMGFLGSKAKLTPNLDSLARQSLVFEDTYSQVPLTTASHASLFTGTYPQFHGVNDFAKPLPSALPALAPLLKENGYQTAAFVGSMILDPKNLAPGFDRGFDVYDAGYHMRRPGKQSRYGTIERRAFEVIDRAESWLEKRESKAPLFLWVHLFDAHEPYEAPGAYGEQYGKTYDGEIAYVDAAVGLLLNVLSAQKLLADSLLVITSDHGEALGDHGERSHGVFLYDETVRVPLLLKLPTSSSLRRAKVAVKRRAELVDILPSVLTVLRIPTPTSVQGQSLLQSAQSGTEVAYSETDYPQRAFGWSRLAALRRDKYLYIQAPERELYNLDTDPEAKRNIASISRAVADTLAAEVESFHLRTSRSTAPMMGLPSPEQSQQLAALGYVTGVTSPAEKTNHTSIDPKAKIEIANALHEAVTQIEDGDYSSALPLLQKVVKSDPQIYTAQFQLGITYAKRREFAQAVPHLQKAVAIQPDSTMAQYELGFALYESGNAVAAVPHFEKVVEKMPQWADAQFSLGSVYARTGHVREALDRLQTALDLDPEHFRANLLAGRILALQGRADVGLPLLEKAVSLGKNSREAHAFLADAYRKLGRLEDAERHEREAARAVDP